MGKRIDIREPVQGFGNLQQIMVEVIIYENNSMISQRFYYFNMAEYCAYADNYTPIFGSIHFGRHSINISNGDYDTFHYNGGDVITPAAIISSVSEAIANLPMS